MARRRKAGRLGMVKKSSKVKKAAAHFGAEADPEGLNRPGQEEWNQMEQGGTLTVTVRKHVFHKGDDVVIRSRDGTDNVWIGRIQAMRRRIVVVEQQNLDEGWAEVRWYYSPRDLHGLNIDRLDGDSFSSRERVLSDTLDLVPTDSFKRPVQVHIWHEEGLEPPELDQSSYFHRYSLKNAFSVPRLSPFPGEFSCICFTPYDPFPTHLDVAEAALKAYLSVEQNRVVAPSKTERIADYMHFCPRPKCSRWFHETCLVHRAQTNPDSTDYVGSAAVRRLSVDPDSLNLHPKLAKFTYEKPPRGKSSSAGALSARETLLAAMAPDADIPLPQSLIDIATMPIIRRAGQGAFSTAGNVRDVVLARRMVYQMLDGGFDDLKRLAKSLPEGWDIALDEFTYGRMWRFLSTQRILASPRAAFWDQRLEELAVHSDRPVLHCPDCKGESPIAI